MDQSRKIFVLLALLSLFLFLQGCVVAAAGGCAAAGAAMAVDRRTTGTMLDDQSIEIKAMHAISNNKELWKASHITFLSYNNVLLMVGQTPTEAYRLEAEEAVSSIPKIRRVHNELTVGEPISLSQRSKDGWITTQIKTKMLANKQIGANRVKVITEDNVVYFMGLTTTEEEEIATDIARETKGVEKVVQIFEQTNVNNHAEDKPHHEAAPAVSNGPENSEPLVTEENMVR